MNEPPGRSSRSLEDDLAAWGKVIAIETHGRSSGRIRRAIIGYVTESDGGLLVAASDDATHWARNLMAQPSCTVESEGVRSGYRAARLEGPDAHAAVAALILKYGTPAERLGGGPAFRLLPVPPRPSAERP